MQLVLAWNMHDLTSVRVVFMVIVWSLYFNQLVTDDINQLRKDVEEAKQLLQLYDDTLGKFFSCRNLLRFGLVIRSLRRKNLYNQHRIFYWSFFIAYWVCNYQLMRIFIFCSDGFPYVFAPVFSTPAFSTPAFSAPPPTPRNNPHKHVGHCNHRLAPHVVLS